MNRSILLVRSSDTRDVAEENAGAVVAIEVDSPFHTNRFQRTTVRNVSISLCLLNNSRGALTLLRRMPSSIATWCLILFFLFYGLSAFGLAIPGIILGLLALGVAIFTFVGR
jgi:hypothetical protein